MYLYDDDIEINENILNSVDSAIKDAVILAHNLPQMIAFIDQIAIIIGNKALENANNALKNIDSYDINIAIITLNNTYNELESRLNIAKIR